MPATGLRTQLRPARGADANVARDPGCPGSGVLGSRSESGNTEIFVVACFVNQFATRDCLPTARIGSRNAASASVLPVVTLGAR